MLMLQHSCRSVDSRMRNETLIQDESTEFYHMKLHQNISPFVGQTILQNVLKPFSKAMINGLKYRTT
jgi:hypothetical protein